MKTIYILSAFAMIGLTACQATMPRYESEFGDSIRNTFNAQVINPDASNNPDPVSGIDGRAARDVINNYQKSFAKPEPAPNVFNLGVGNSDAGGEN